MVAEAESHLLPFSFMHTYTYLPVITFLPQMLMEFSFVLACPS